MAEGQIKLGLDRTDFAFGRTVGLFDYTVDTFLEDIGDAHATGRNVAAVVGVVGSANTRLAGLVALACAAGSPTAVISAILTRALGDTDHGLATVTDSVFLR